MSVLTAASDDVLDVVATLSTMPPGPELMAALSGVDPASQSAHGLVLLAQAWERQKAHAEAQQLAVLAALAAQPEYSRCTYPGAGSGAHQHRAVQAAGSEVSLALAWTPGRATNRVATAVELVEDLPDTLAALRTGRIDAEKARLIADRTRCLPDPGVRRVVEAAVLPVAPRKTRTALDAMLRRQVIVADPAAAEQRCRAAAERRRVERPEPASAGEDGLAQILVYGPAEDLTALWTAVDAAARHARSRGDQRTLDQLRFDTLTGLGWAALSMGHLGCCAPACTDTSAARGGTTPPPPGAGPEPNPAGSRKHPHRLAKRRGRAAAVMVTVPISALASADEEPGWLDGFGPVTAGAARRIATEGTLRRLLTDPVDGRVLEYGRTTYAPPAELADFVIARDRTCRFPTCTHQGTDTDIDHQIPYSDGGTTGAANTWLLHRTHHLDRTHHGHHIRTSRDATTWWTTPSGFSYPIAPAPVGTARTRPEQPESPPY